MGTYTYGAPKWTFRATEVSPTSIYPSNDTFWTELEPDVSKVKDEFKWLLNILRR